MKFLLNSTDAELLIYFESNPSLEALAKALGRNSTVISRQLKRISECGDFLTKVSGRWKLTETGMKLNQITREYILAQDKITKKEIHLKIGATREFSAKILGNHFKELKQALSVDSLSLISLEKDIEEALLGGIIDFAFDCGRPYSPDIAYKQIMEEPISPVISKKLAKEYRNIKNFKNLEEYPHILCERLLPEQVKQGKFQLRSIAARTNDIATARNLCLSSQGWALLPLYAIKDELNSGKLVIINDITFRGIKFGVMQLRSRKNLRVYFQRLVNWMIKMDSLLELG